MRRSLCLVGILITVLGMSASGAEPGPNGRNNHGLCTAYFAGSANGRAHKRNAPPFQNLERAAGVEEGDTPEEIDQKVREFCRSATPGGKGTTPRGGSGRGGTETTTSPDGAGSGKGKPADKGRK